MVCRRHSIAILLVALSCKPAAAPSAPAHRPEAARTEIRVCGAPTDDWKAFAGTGARPIEVERDDDGCGSLVADPHWTTMVSTRRGDAMAVLWVLPVPGRIDAQVAPPGTGTGAALQVRSTDGASRVAAALTLYMDSLRLDRSPEALAIATRHATAAEGVELLAWSMIRYLMLNTPGRDSTDADRRAQATFLRTLDASSWAWSIGGEAPIVAIRAGDLDPEQATTIARTHPDPDVRSSAAVALADDGKRRGDLEAIRAALAIVRADTDATATLMGKIIEPFDPDRGVREGSSLPPIHLVDLETGAPIDLAAAPRRVLLLHIWATWCTSCRAGITALESIRAAHGESVTIVSISIDEDPRVIAPFRADGFPMPWTHARVRGETIDAFRRRFEVVGSGRLLVVDPRGKVSAELGSATDDAFAPALERALADAR